MLQMPDPMASLRLTTPGVDSAERETVSSPCGLPSGDEISTEELAGHASPNFHPNWASRSWCSTTMSPSSIKPGTVRMPCSVPAKPAAYFGMNFVALIRVPPRTS
jgi:hypothetical protein